MQMDKPIMMKPKKTASDVNVPMAEGVTDPGTLYKAGVFGRAQHRHHFWKIQIVPRDTECVFALPQIFSYFLFQTCIRNLKHILKNSD